MGLLISIEGTDGAGKRTQTEALRKLLEKQDLVVNWFTFPQYETSFMSKIIIKFLNGDLGESKNYHPIMKSLMFSLERFEEKETVAKLRDASDVLILDRYIASNLGYQLAQLSEDDRSEYQELILGIELDILGLPRPDLNFFLNIRPEIAQQNVANKPERGFLKDEYDENERDLKLLTDTYSAYQYLMDENILGPWVSIDCHGEDGVLLPQDKITKKLADGLAHFTKLSTAR
jgi:dTMP kinase